VTYRRWTL